MRKKWFDKAVAWTKEKDPKNAELLLVWTEAAGLLGQPGSEAARPELACGFSGKATEMNRAAADSLRIDQVRGVGGTMRRPRVRAR